MRSPSFFIGFHQAVEGCEATDEDMLVVSKCLVCQNYAAYQALTK